MRKTIHILIFLIFFLLSNGVFATSTVTGFRTADKHEYSRFVIDVTESPNYSVFTLKDPSRVVIDLKNVTWGNFSEPPEATKRIKEVRYANKGQGNIRIVVDVNTTIKHIKHFILDSTQTTPHRLVIDITPEKPDEILLPTPSPVSKAGISINAPKPELKTRRKPLIIIDAGHGGQDPGSIGKRGTKEKNVTLSFAKVLRDTLKNSNRYKVYMTRNGDYYVKLRSRVNKARKAKGDLFISLHADSHKNQNTKGLSVYTLSERASDKEAKALAEKENKEGIITGIDLKHEDNEISSILIDLVQRDTKNLSASFAEELLKELGKVTRLLRNSHRFAGFRVLTGPDIPSVLVELGYLSNRQEEKQLNSYKYKKKVANSVLKAIDNHFKKYRVE